MAGISTHVLDNYTGRPGAGMRIDFSARQADGSWKLVKTMTTNADGRTDAPLIEGDDLVPGTYQIEYAVGPYFAGLPLDPSAAPAEPYLDRVPVRVNLAPVTGPVHVALLVTPWSYTTYRGS